MAESSITHNFVISDPEAVLLNSLRLILVPRAMFLIWS